VTDIVGPVQFAAFALSFSEAVPTVGLSVKGGLKVKAPVIFEQLADPVPTTPEGVLADAAVVAVVTPVSNPTVTATKMASPGALPATRMVMPPLTAR
jgi:hypothetical protein